MLAKTRSIVLRSIKYGESSVITTLYTEQFGRQSLLIHGVRNKKRKINPYLFETLSLLDVDIYRKENRELNSLKEAWPCVILQHIFTDIKKSSIALFLGELLFRALREEECNQPLFNYLFHTIQVLDVAELGLENFPLIFLLQFSKFLGIYPKNNLEFERYQTSEGLQLLEMLDYSITDISQYKISGSKRNELLNLLLVYYSDHLEGIGQLKSLQVLREVYH
jgi:DNA repair protein RecO (recombination protein O)